MKKDIQFHQVKNISLVIERKKNDTDQYEWHVYIINNNELPITNVLISSKGYGTKDGEEQKTSVLRHMIEEIGPMENAIIEPLDPALFHLTNEYWVSYYIEGEIHDKKYLFVPDSISEAHLVKIDLLGIEGVLHN